RLPQSFIFTGIRGVGKTTTARILAKAVNCIGRDPKVTADPCNSCANCKAITEDRHIDVIEMDAASRTGVDDIREVIEAARYKPVSAPRKVYIIDEVHMLSKSAFNALLKTLEEPPACVTFIFATTEIRKVPKTVLSRCMRFDLRSVDLVTLEKHFTNIARLENFQIEESAVTLLARAAEGSVRDGLSLLDQALTLCQQTLNPQGKPKITSQLVCTMLGLSESGKLLAILTALIHGEPFKALSLSRDLFSLGVDPIMLLSDLLDLTHTLTTLKVDPQLAIEINNLAENDRQEAVNLSEKLTMPTLTRMWQVFLKGINEAQISPRPHQACEMILLRVAYLSTLPSLEEVIRVTKSASFNPQMIITQPATPVLSSAIPQMSSRPKSFEELVELFAQHREPLLHSFLKSDVHLVHFGAGTLKLRVTGQAPRDFIARLTQHLQEWTGQSWSIILCEEEGALSLAEQERIESENNLDQAKKDPLVAEALRTFSGAEITSVVALK
ncbi:MAG: DNA polymerase III subunit gamma/tau, partial [Alphaproteobacteria bacterium]|nr:DNA polymerase III subunit gamma/tau [Alphaproteobacteria bacterium]